MTDSRGMASDILAGSPRALARLMRELEDETPQARAMLASLASHGGHAFVVGLTGAPGAGKSTLVDALVTAYRHRGQKVGVVAVDPSSPLSGGALLGDRVRMQQHATDPGVFIRSLAARGNLGGLARSAQDVVDVLDVAGFDVVFVETVGVGQGEMDVKQLADLTVVVTVPGLGDGVQALKSGLLEVADALVVNKADRQGADATERDLRAMLALRAVGCKDVPILRTQALNGSGIAELVGCLDSAATALNPATRVVRRQRRARRRLQDSVVAAARLRIDSRLGEAGWDKWAQEIAAGHRSVEDLLTYVFEPEPGGTIT